MFTWATVTATSPLRIRLDGDSTALPITPDSIVAPLALAVGDRVRVEISRRRVIVHGRAGSIDTGWVDLTSMVTLNTNLAFAEGGLWVRRVGEQVFYDLRRIDTTASGNFTITVTGNITNYTLLSGIPTEFCPTGRTLPLAAGNGGRANSYYITSAGVIGIAAVVPAADQTGSVDCPSGEPFSCGGSFFR